MLKKIALATIATAALVAAPSLAHANYGYNGASENGITLVNGPSENGLMNRVPVNGVESAGREVYVVDALADGQNRTVLTIELPQADVTAETWWTGTA